MTTQEAYETAVEELCAAARRKDFKMASWVACAIEILWERLCQEAIAKNMNAYFPKDIVKLANGYWPTRERIQQMKDNMETYGSMFRSDPVEGLG